MHLTNKEKKQQLNRVRNGKIFDAVTSVDVQGIVKIGGRVSEIYEAVLSVKNFK